MWMGVCGGLILSALLAWAINTAQNEIQGQALEYFNNGIIACAIILMTHMCIWMKQHARTIKSELQTGVEKSLSSSQYWGIALLACLSVGREGSETVIFLYGMAIESIENNEIRFFIGAIALGLVASYLTWIVFNKGLKFFKQQVFFRVTTGLLFFNSLKSYSYVEQKTDPKRCNTFFNVTYLGYFISDR
jgi:high-affinity iron transporter